MILQDPTLLRFLFKTPIALTSPKTIGNARLMTCGPVQRAVRGRTICDFAALRHGSRHMTPPPIIQTPACHQHSFCRNLCDASIICTKHMVYSPFPVRTLPDMQLRRIFQANLRGHHIDSIGAEPGKAQSQSLKFMSSQASRA